MITKRGFVLRGSCFCGDYNRLITNLTSSVYEYCAAGLQIPGGWGDTSPQYLNSIPPIIEFQQKMVKKKPSEQKKKVIKKRNLKIIPPNIKKSHQNMLIIPPMLDTDLQPCCADIETKTFG